MWHDQATGHIILGLITWMPLKTKVDQSSETDNNKQNLYNLNLWLENIPKMHDSRDRSSGSFHFVNRILNLPLIPFFWSPAWIYKKTFFLKYIWTTRYLRYYFSQERLVKIWWRHIWRHSDRYIAFTFSVSSAIRSSK